MFSEISAVEAILLFGGTLLGSGLTLFFSVRGQRRSYSLSGPETEDATFSCVFTNGELVDTSVGAEVLIGGHRDENESYWDAIRRRCQHRFGDLPKLPDDVFVSNASSERIFPARKSDDDGQLVFSRLGNNVRLTLMDRMPTELERQVMLDTRRELGILRNAIDHAPNPVWTTNPAGHVTWSNRAYRDLADLLDRLNGDSEDARTPLFETADDKRKIKPVRVPLQLKDSSKRHWYEVVTRPYRDGFVSYATNIDAVINAEIAQRNFVQTLTKTFAQLSIGLAIFDRNKQLALFNPALIDLTALPADFLSARPDLLSFFDHMRNAQIMPEPKNYGSWREKMSDLVAAAQDGRYSETWNLPSGLTYRVSGKPHPDGAVAFLFEDISAEISLTRRFRADLELCHAVLDRQKSAVAVFSSLQTLTFCNEAFRKVWDWDPDNGLTETRLQDALNAWTSACTTAPELQPLVEFVQSRGDSKNLHLSMQHKDFGELGFVAEPLPGGATMVTFDPVPIPEDASAQS